MSKRILIVGATGTVGRALVQQIAGRHDVIPVGRTRADYQVDITDSESIRRLFEQVGRFDALVATAGKVHFGELSAMTEKEMAVGLRAALSIWSAATNPE